MDNTIPFITHDRVYNNKYILQFFRLLGLQQKPLLENKKYIHWCEIHGDYTDSPSLDFYAGEFAHLIDKCAISNAQTNKCVIVFCTAQESFAPTAEYPIKEHIDVDLILKTFCDEHRIPYANVAWLSGDLRVQQRQHHPEIQTGGLSVYSHELYRQTKENIPDFYTHLVPYNQRQFKKNYLCLNRWLKSGRLYWLWHLNQHTKGLLDKGYVSCPDRMFDYNFLDKAKAWCRHWGKHHQYLRTFENEDDWINRENMFRQFADLSWRLPLTLDVKDMESNFCAGADTTLSSIPYYNNTVFSVITESQIEGDALFISEAAYRPFLYETPAMWIGQPGIVARLQEFGFETWGWLIDEHYDTVPKMCDRLDYAMSSFIDFNNKIQNGKIDQRIKDIIHQQNQHNKQVSETIFMDYQRRVVSEILGRFTEI